MRVLKMDEEKLLLLKVSNVETRLSNVETTMDLFRDRILENEHRTKEGLQKSLSNLKHNLAKNSLEVRKLQLIWTDFSPRGICKITSRTIHIKLREDMPSNVPVAPALPLFRMVNRSSQDLIGSDNM